MHVLHIISWLTVLIPSLFKSPIYYFKVQGMRSVSDVEWLIVFQGAGYGISFWCGKLIVFQGVGHEISFRCGTIDCVSGHRAWCHQGLGYCLVREGISYIKGAIFPPFAFLHPLSSSIKLFILLAHHPLSWPPMLKTSSMRLVRLVVPLLGI
jgi:hypothetical protein